MKLRVLLMAMALMIGLAVPFLQIWLKVILFAAVLLADAGTGEKSENRSYSVSLFFVAGLILSYLYKLIWL